VDELRSSSEVKPDEGADESTHSSFVLPIHLMSGCSSTRSRKVRLNCERQGAGMESAEGRFVELESEEGRRAHVSRDAKEAPDAELGETVEEVGAEVDLVVGELAGLGHAERARG